MSSENVKDIDISLVIMILVPKWTSFAWSYSDGLKGKYFDKSYEERQIKALPNFYNYISYLHHLSGSIVGPNF